MRFFDERACTFVFLARTRYCWRASFLSAIAEARRATAEDKCRAREKKNFRVRSLQMQGSASPVLVSDEDSGAQPSRAPDPLPVEEAQSIGPFVLLQMILIIAGPASSGPRGCTLYEGFTVRGISYGCRNVVILTNGRYGVHRTSLSLRQLNLVSPPIKLSH